MSAAPRHSHKPDNQSGFSLIEVMIAIIILAIVVIPLLRIQINLYRRQLRINHTNAATLLAQSNMEKALNILQKAAKGGPNNYNNWMTVHTEDNSGCSTGNIYSDLSMIGSGKNYIIEDAPVDPNCPLSKHLAKVPGRQSFDDNAQQYSHWLNLSFVCRDQDTYDIIPTATPDNCGATAISDNRTLDITSIVEWDEPGIAQTQRVEIRGMVIDLDIQAP